MVKANSGTSTSQHIRDLLTENPALTTPEIIDALAKKGIRAKPALVYFVKGRFKAKKRRAGRKAAAHMLTSSGSSNGSLDPVALISKTKALAAELGGMAKLKELVEALS